MQPSPEAQQLIALFNARRYPELETAARNMVEKNPQFGFGWKALGIAIGIRGGDALPVLEKARDALPNDPEAHVNLGNALRERGRATEAVECYRHAVRLAPDFPPAHCNLGNALKDLGQFEAAAQSCRRALQLAPDYPEALANLGVALKELGQTGEALRCYQRALQLKPDFAEAHSNLGNALLALGQPEQAEASCRRALAIAPNFAQAHNNLGNALREAGRSADALQSYRRAIELNPGYAEAHNNLGTALREGGLFEDALASCRRAIELKPAFAEAHSNLGAIHKDLGRLDASVQCFERAIELNPGLAEAHSNLLFVLNYMHARPRLALRDAARHYGEMVARRTAPFTDWPNSADAQRTLRVGFVSGDLHNHPVGYFLESVVARLDRSKLALFAYHTSGADDALSARLRAYIPNWRQVRGAADEVLAQQIRADAIDILIDLSGHTAHNRLPLFARKPAPVQAAWLGYFATTGVPAIDYIIVDPVAAPADEDEQFTETAWRLPETRLCFTPPEADIAVGPLPAQSSGHITFGCFGNHAKINTAVLDLWARVLHALPASTLLLKSKALGDAATQQALLGEFTRRGIDAARILTEGQSARADYLAAYHRIDIVLDTFPFPGGTTTAEALWMGVPVIGLRGDRLLSRQGESLLVNAGLADWVARDADDFVAIAKARAGAIDAIDTLARLRAGLRQRVLASPLYDAARFAAHFETALRGMWARWCEQRART